MSSQHPVLMAVLNTQFPKEVVVKGVASVNQHSSAVALQYEDQTVIKSMEKVYLDRVYQRVIPTLYVTHPITVSEVLRLFCERDNLFLVPGVDYDLNDTVLNAQEETNLIHLNVKADSPFYKGELFIPVKGLD